jgi:hypothetical protein
MKPLQNPPATGFIVFVKTDQFIVHILKNKFKQNQSRRGFHGLLLVFMF